MVAWISHGVGRLSDESLAVLAATLIMVRIRNLFTSLLLSILGLAPVSLTARISPSATLERQLGDEPARQPVRPPAERAAHQAGGMMDGRDREQARCLLEAQNFRRPAPHPPQVSANPSAESKRQAPGAHRLCPAVHLTQTARLVEAASEPPDGRASCECTTTAPGTNALA